MLPKVDFARRDAEGFAQALKLIYPDDKLDIALLIDSQATSSSLDYVLQTIVSDSSSKMLDMASTARAAIA